MVNFYHRFLRHCASLVQSLTDLLSPKRTSTDHIDLDIVGPLPPSQGYHYLLISVDRYTRWPQRQFLFLILLLKLLLVLLLPIGVLSTVKTDCSTQFEYSPLTALKYLLGTKRIHTTAYQPCANGMVERFHRQFIACFNSSSDSSEWTDLLLLFPLSIRCSLKQDILCTPAQLVYGSTLRLPSQFFTPSSVDKQLDPAIYADRLSSYMQQLRPVPPRP